MKTALLLFLTFFSALSSNAQSKKVAPIYEISIQLKSYKDTVAYLCYYEFGKKITAATCNDLKNDKIIFKGKGKLKTGLYSLFGSDKKSYLDFFIDETTQKLEIKSDDTENYLKGAVALNSKLENDFFSFIKYSIRQNMALKEIIALGKGLAKKDSIALVSPKFKAVMYDIYNYEENFINQNKGTYIADVINLKIDRFLRDIPNASNGRPDSLLVKKYYRKHYWDNVSFKDLAICRNQFFVGKVNNYFDNVVPFDVDSVTVEIDKFIDKTKVNPTLTKLLLDHLVNKYELASMGFDKVLIRLVDTYFKSGKANLFYKDQSEIDRIIRRAEKIRPLQIGKIAPDLAMIRASDRNKLVQMGFENVKTSDELTKLFYSKQADLNNMYLRMNSIQAKYLIVVFWDVDCSHCKTEIPKLSNLYHEFQKENKDVKVFSVYVYHEVDKYIKYIDENKLDWINVYDGAYNNNVVDKYEIRTTPVIYILDENKVIKTKKVPVDKIKSFLTDLEKK